jgi:hypothetical protein
MAVQTDRCGLLITPAQSLREAITRLPEARLFVSRGDSALEKLGGPILHELPAIVSGDLRGPEGSEWDRQAADLAADQLQSPGVPYEGPRAPKRAGTHPARSGGLVNNASVALSWTARVPQTVNMAIGELRQFTLLPAREMT